MRNGMFTVDAHTHIFNSPTYVNGRRAFFPAERLVRQMDVLGIDMSLLIAQPRDEGSIRALARLHDEVAGIVSRFPDRFMAAAWFAPHLGQAASAELRRCIAVLGFSAIKLHPEESQFNLDGAEAVKAAKEAAELGVPVLAHTQLAARGAEPWRLVRLARKFPSVSFVMAHMGGDGAMLQTGEATRLAASVHNVYVEGSATVTDPAATYLEPARTLGPERVIFGSDEPIHQAALALLKLDLVEMPDEWRVQIQGGNARRLFRR